MKRAIEYQANDGTRFATADECKRHEQDTSMRCLINMTNDQVKDALARTDVQLADAIEFAGKLISEKRRAMGGMRRKRKTIAEKHAEGAKTIAEKHAEVDATITTMQPKKAKK